MSSLREQPVGRPVFVATILVGSFLLFMVQPMIARMALPRLGGAPNVWNSAMLVYQALLLAGYAYAHRISTVPMPRQAQVHIALMVIFAISLPIALFRMPPPEPGWEVLWVPALLMMTIGPIFFIISAQAPLMQRWFSANPAAGEPWALYAASNLGSFAGLMAYPLLLEPVLALEKQSLYWSLGYAVLVILVIVCARMRWNARFDWQVSEQADDAPAEDITWSRIGLWLALSAIPSGLMLSTTTHLTTDIFAMPLLWVIPLGLYLLSFVFAFADNRQVAGVIALLAPITMLLAGGVAMVSTHSGNMTMAFASVLLLFMVAVSLHARLYDLRPHAAQLTKFYLAMSVGGALGGAFTALAAPVLFDWVWEHPILVLAAALLMPLPELLNWRRLEGIEPRVERITLAVLFAAAVFLAGTLSDLASDKESSLVRVFLTLLMTGIGILLVGKRWMFVTVLVMLMLAQGGAKTIQTSWEDKRTRSYFGIYTVDESHGTRRLVHGTTLHGQQSLEPETKLAPTTYYGDTSGAGIALEEAQRLYGEHSRVGVVGLGAGTLACRNKPGQTWTFFEIDPAVLAYSRDGTFSYLSDCAPDSKVILGDARIELEALPASQFDVLIVDAFSSDAIPLHLLTEEAMDVYLRSLSEGGMAVIHISNRYIELEPVIAAIAKSHGLAARMRFDAPEDKPELSPSKWVALTRDPAKLEALAGASPDSPWQDLARPAPRPWTDDFASILPYIRWTKLLGEL